MSVTSSTGEPVGNAGQDPDLPPPSSAALPPGTTPIIPSLTPNANNAQNQNTPASKKKPQVGKISSVLSLKPKRRMLPEDFLISDSLKLSDCIKQSTKFIEMVLSTNLDFDCALMIVLIENKKMALT